MARLKFGNFEIQAEMPEVLKMPEMVAPALQPSELDVLAIVQKAIADLPKAPEMPAKDSGLEELVNDQSAMLIELHDRVTELELAPAVELPEVKHITIVKDVSADHLKHWEQMVLKTELKCMKGLSTLEEQARTRLQTQKRLNCILTSLLIITTLLHLL